MKQFKEEDLVAVEKKLNNLERSLDMYKKCESQSKLMESNIEIERTLKQIEALRQSKAREIYSMLKKYGWPVGIKGGLFDTMIEALEYGELDVLLKIVPYANNAYQMKKLDKDYLDKILDIISLKEEVKPDYTNIKTFK